MPWDEPTARALGATLRRLRTERELSQETLAFRAGVTKNQVQLLEAGRSSGRKDSVGPSNPRLSTLAGLADALGVPVSGLLAEAGL
ncbi:helix-turn-helix transcriptional regulator [Cellulosimicrobium funkei]|uniref:helix-turn-helix domain-containing protein n=1 Tax=Cellulosimicrobium funkei TaxID=264251 RepID=UPI0030FD0C61